MHRGRLAPGLALGLVAAACSGDDGSTLDASPFDARPGDPNLRVGAFAVEVTGPDGVNPGRTSVLGTVFDAPQPSSVIWEIASSDGPCQLLTPRLPFCATPCGAAVCVEDGVCQDYATKKSVGAVRVTGIAIASGGADFVMEAIAENYQPPAGVTPAYPPFAAGDPIRFAAAGSAWQGGFAIDTVGVDTLVMTSADPDLARDQPIALTWTAGTAATTVGVKLDISHHGGTRGKIECSGPDRGAMTVAGALVTGLLDLGASGFPTIIVTRAVTGSAVITAGRVDLELRSQVERPVTVPGIESCDKDQDCTLPETCRDDLTCG